MRAAKSAPSASVGAKVRFEVLKRDGFRCAYCGRHADEATIEIDHVVPRAKGGTNKAENLVAACAKCNRGKGETPMPVTLKRINGEAIQPAEPSGPDPDELRAIGLLQLEDHRRRFFDAAQRFARGIALWNEKGWAWAEPNWAQPREEWPPLARLIWYAEAMCHAAGQAQFLRHLPTHPGWCPDCHPDEGRPEGFTMSACMEHTKPEVIEAMAQGLFVIGDHAEGNR